MKRRGKPPSFAPPDYHRRKGLTGQALWDAVDRFALKAGHPERVRVH